MSSKRKWDQPGPSDATTSADPASTDASADNKTDETKTASEAAAAAAAIAAKIAAQFAGGSLGGLAGGGGLMNSMGPGGDAEFTHDIDINDVRNRYMLTKSSTQQDIQAQTGASVSTKGTWIPDRSKATEKDPPLYLHIMANTREQLQKAIDRVNELIAIDMGSLVEDKQARGKERRKWPEEKLPVGLESIRNFNVRAKVVGPSGVFVKYIQQETGTRVQIKGIGSGFVEQETGKESEEPLYIHITGPEESAVARAKVLTGDLLLVVRSEHAKMMTLVQQQQMELHQAQMQAAWGAGGGMGGGYGGYAPPPPSDAPPPPPPGEQPPPPPDGANYAGYNPAAASAAQPPAPGADGAGGQTQTPEQYAAYWAAYGYDVNSPEFKEWAAQQQQQYSAYYAQAAAAASGQPGQPGPPGGEAPAPPPASQPPPPPPPA